MAFEVKSPDGIAAWRKVYDRIVTLRVDEVITNETLGEVVGINFRGPTTRAVKELEAKNKRTLISVRGVGYRVAKANEHARVGQEREERARRQVKRGHHTVVNTDLADLTAVELDRHEKVEARLSAMEALMRSTANGTKTMAEMMRDTLAKTKGENESLKRVVADLRKEVDAATPEPAISA